MSVLDTQADENGISYLAASLPILFSRDTALTPTSDCILTVITMSSCRHHKREYRT